MIIAIGNCDWGLGLEIVHSRLGLWIGYWDWGLRRIGYKDWGFVLGMRLEIGGRDWDQRL